jgi:hypothetical protein
MPRKKAAKKIKLDDLDKPLTEQEMKESTGGATFIAQYVPPPPVGPGVILPQGAPQGKSPSPQGPPPLAPGLHLQVTDGAIVVTNNGGSQGFQAGQFGFVPSINQPPVIVPTNPNIQFTPPPSFDAGSGGPVRKP